ncbi:hypothetical protein OS493_003322 [Desmophyllum pertusum]|uniref:RNA-dependent RNA polymerase n=1 Tax=Desmophyllum pertusum TaxID=174260 RepID=A0A9X0A574_9CNID|nr:hypothetical protein OS493_003322 [Desmophyllum pertusum]
MLLFETLALDTLRRTKLPWWLENHSIVTQWYQLHTRTILPLSCSWQSIRADWATYYEEPGLFIPETHGRLLMGVIDETGTLEYGQVFVRYSKLVSEPGKELITLKGKVVISKNPCFHPGDMRTFEAVDVRVLHHLVDCIVFPAKGHRPPH